MTISAEMLLSNCLRDEREVLKRDHDIQGRPISGHFIHMGKSTHLSLNAQTPQKMRLRYLAGPLGQPIGPAACLAIRHETRYNCWSLETVAVIVDEPSSWEEAREEQNLGTDWQSGKKIREWGAHHGKDEGTGEEYQARPSRTE